MESGITSSPLFLKGKPRRLPLGHPARLATLPIRAGARELLFGLFSTLQNRIRAFKISAFCWTLSR
jgi:hypothetical protein